jgi:serine/threonine protein kinase
MWSISEGLNMDESNLDRQSSLKLETPATMKQSTPTVQPVSLTRTYSLDTGLDIAEDSFIKRWLAKDKVFDGKFSTSGASTPLSPCTPLLTSLRKDSLGTGKDTKQEYLEHKALRLNVERILENQEDDLSPRLLRTEVIQKFCGTPLMSRYEADFIECEQLGSGCFGSVYKCRNRYDGLMYAVKHIRTSVSCHATRQSGLREATALAASTVADDNAYVIRYHSVWIESDCLYISMELCDCSLSKYIEQVKVTEALIGKVLHDICKGLSMLHHRGVVHLDIKAENILHSYSKKFKLADLGLAQITTNLNLDCEINEGDSRYLAPEMLQIVGDFHGEIPDLTKADVFSLGATILELMLGKTLPCNGPDWHNIRKGEFEVKGYSPELVEVVRLMLSLNPANRPSAKELLETYLLSSSKQELRRLQSYTKWLEHQVNEPLSN